MPETEITGLVNGHFVDGRLARSGDVSAEGVQILKRHDLRLVICLKDRDKFAEVANERAMVEAAGIRFQWSPMKNRGVFSYKDGEKVPEILHSIYNAPPGVVLVHCHLGSDRTGVVSGCYEIGNGTSLKLALEHMKKYGSAWYNFGQRRFVEKFAKEHGYASNQ